MKKSARVCAAQIHKPTRQIADINRPHTAPPESTVLTAADPLNPPRWNPLEAVFAFLLPGLGHVLLGEVKRGLIIGGFTLALFFGGLLLGGIAIVDRDAPNPPFVRVFQVFLAPTWAAEWVREHHLVAAPRTQGSALLFAEDPPLTARTYTPSFGRMEEQGVLYTAVAGLLNVMAIVDVLYRRRATPRRRRGAADVGAVSA